VIDELDVDRAMDVFYADRLPADLPMADYEDADGNLRRRESDGGSAASTAPALRQKESHS
jgi:hypothetical protein